MGMYTQVQFEMIVKPEFRKYTEVYTMNQKEGHNESYNST